MPGLILLLEEHEKTELEFKIRSWYCLDSQSQRSVIAVQVKHGIYAIICAMHVSETGKKQAKQSQL